MLLIKEQKTEIMRIEEDLLNGLDLLDVRPTLAAIDKVLDKFVETGEITRIAPGMYIKNTDAGVSRNKIDSIKRIRSG